MRNNTFTLVILLLFCLGASAQKKDKQLTIQVTSVEGDNLEGQVIVLKQTDYQLSYGTLKLDAEGQCNVKVYAGNHRLTIDRDGFEPLSHDFVVESDLTVSVSLTEKTRTPYALSAQVVHNAYTGQDDIELNWNTEAPAFFDDFESYEGWSINFGDWTGIDGDQEVAAPLLGSYPNRGVMQYAQIINPLTVEPTWWYDYPILRPYEGQQYVGFTRTNSGNANNDWLITPVITVGTDNEFAFMAKAADRYPERFMVYITTVLEQPVQSDFVRLDQGNYESVDYTEWHRCSYDLSDYAGQKVKLAIRYIGEYNRYGSFMLMVDNVYVGQKPLENRGHLNAKVRRCENSIDDGNLEPSHSRTLVPPKQSPANPNEVFHIYLDGEEAGTTENYTYTLENVSAGEHTVGVKAVYIAAESEMVTVDVNVEKEALSHVVFNVAANSILQPEGIALQLVGITNGQEYNIVVTDGKAEIQSLPNGQYVVNIAEGAYEQYQQTIDVTEDATFDIVLEDHMIEPYNITANADEQGSYTIRWNQELSFVESFEDYDDFATGSFGEWKSIDRDQMPVYPISLFNQIITFPGSGTQNNPTAIAPLVFNPWNTVPAMLPSDQAVAAPTGDKTIIFFSPQMARADKWLISPLFTINKDYEFSVTAKGYEAMYPESMEFCISDGSDQPDDFTVLSEANPLSAGEWMKYSTSLADYEGQQVRLAIHYTSYDAFFAQIDDFTVGPEEGKAVTVDYGNVVRFDIYLDGEKVGETTEATYILPVLNAGTHTVGIVAVYQNGQSTMAEYVINMAATALRTVECDTVPQQQEEVFDLQGRRIANNLSTRQLVNSSTSKKGIYIIRNNNQTRKVIR